MLSRRAVHNLNYALKGIKRCASTSTSALKTNDAAITKKEEAPVTQQAPNYPATWSTSQRPRPGPASGPRFEQTAMALQPNPLSAMQLVAEEPIRLVQGRKAVCDGGTCKLLKSLCCLACIQFSDVFGYLICAEIRRRALGTPKNLH